MSPGTLCMNSVTVPTPLSTSAAAAHSSSASVSSTHSAAAAPRLQPWRERQPTGFSSSAASRYAVINGAAHGSMKRTHSHTRPTVPAAYSSSAKYPASFSCIPSPPVVFSPGIICQLYRFLFIEPPAAALYIMDWAGAFCAAPAL